MASSEITSEISLNSEQVKVSPIFTIHHLLLVVLNPLLQYVTTIAQPSDQGSKADLQLCNPSKLRSSQLTDRTFRLYLLDHMSQETTRVIEELSEVELETALKEVFPEYRPLLPSRALPQVRTPLRSHSLNSIHDDPDSTPRQRKIYTPRPIPAIPGFTISSILSVSQLEELADMVVEEQSRKEEKRRRRRIRDGTATQKDLQYRSQSSTMTSESQSSVKSQSGWRLSSDEKRARKERLVKWVIRGLSEEGVLVQIRMKADEKISTSQSRTKRYIEAYLPLPEPLLLPLLIPHLSAEIHHRSKIYIPRSDPRYGHGILLEEVLKRLRGCGEDGRWERVGEYCVEDALHYGEGKGLKRVGRGWVIA